MSKQTPKPSRTQVNLIVDVIIFFAVLVSAAPHFTGMAIHEWLGIALGAMILTHLLLHWQWLVAITQRFLRNAPLAARTNYVLNALLFVTMTVIIFTGLMISEVAVPLLGIEVAKGGVWKLLHTQATNLVVILIGLHLALHWSWVTNTINRYAIKPVWTGVRHGLRFAPDTK